MLMSRFVLALAVAAPLMLGAAQDELGNWPEEAAPRIVGKRVAENFIVRPYRAQSDPTKARIGIIYPEVCTWYGAMTFAVLMLDM